MNYTALKQNASKNIQTLLKNCRLIAKRQSPDYRAYYAVTIEYCLQFRSPAHECVFFTLFEMIPNRRKYCSSNGVYKVEFDVHNTVDTFTMIAGWSEKNINEYWIKRYKKLKAYKPNAGMVILIID